MSFEYRDLMIPVSQGFATSPGWTAATDGKPMGVTWHWTAMPELSDTRALLQGGAAGGSARLSAHYGVGARFVEGVDRYVALGDRAWHAGKAQVLRWDGARATAKTTAARTCIGVMAAYVGYARRGNRPGQAWDKVADPDCKKIWALPPWPDQQVEMMIAVGREIRAAWPHIPWQHHHGHHDICPGYKQDVVGFPFAQVLRGIYDDPSIPDVWTPLNAPTARQRALIALGYDLGPRMDDGYWGDLSQEALAAFQQDTGAPDVPYWTTFTAHAIHKALSERGLDLARVTAVSPGRVRA